MAIQESGGEFHEELEHEEGVGAEEERVPEIGKKAKPETGKGTPTWRLIESYRDKKRLENELEELDDLDDLDEE